VKRRYYKNWYFTKRKAFSKIKNDRQTNGSPNSDDVKLGSKKAELIEIQISGGKSRIREAPAAEDNCDFAGLCGERKRRSDFGREGARLGGSRVLVRQQAAPEENTPRKAKGGPHRAAESDAGAVDDRTGNNGFHHRTEVNRWGALAVDGARLDEEGDYAVEGFTRCGLVRNDFLLIKATCAARRRGR
jgi:ribosomal protein L3